MSERVHHTEARRLLGTPLSGDATEDTLRHWDANTCAILAVADAIEELTSQITALRPL